MPYPDPDKIRKTLADAAKLDTPAEILAHLKANRPAGLSPEPWRNRVIRYEDPKLAQPDEERDG